MQIITLFTSKGGAGRYSTTLALAAGYLFLEKRVLLVDASANVRSDQSRNCPSLLDSWKAWIAQNELNSSDLSVAECSSPAELTERLKGSELSGIDLVLLDARAADPSMQQAAVAMSDLIVASALTPEQAKEALTAGAFYLDDRHKAFGLISVNAVDLEIADASIGNEADIAALDVAAGQFVLDDIAYHSNALNFGLNTGPAMGFHAARIFCSAIVTNRLPGTQAIDRPALFISPRGNAFETVLIGR